MAEASMVLKASSVSEWSKVDPDFAEVLGEVSRNTAHLFMGPWSVDINDAGSGFRVVFEGSGKLGMAAAVPVAEDGYFLTVAHAVDTAERLTLVAWVEDADFSGPRQSTPRIVWTPGKGRGPDIALLHADLWPVQAFEMADMPYVTQPVGVTGSSAMMRLAINGTESDLTQFSSVAIGRVVKVGRARGGKQGPAFRLVRHNAPTVHGDSGGALVDKQGSLLGINSTVHPPSWLGWFPYVGVRMSAAIDGVSFHSQAIRPDFAWLRNLIEADRRKRIP